MNWVVQIITALGAFVLKMFLTEQKQEYKKAQLTEKQKQMQDKIRTLRKTGLLMLTACLLQGCSIAFRPVNTTYFIPDTAPVQLAKPYKLEVICEGMVDGEKKQWRTTKLVQAGAWIVYDLGDE